MIVNSKTAVVISDSLRPKESAKTSVLVKNKTIKTEKIRFFFFF